MQIKTNCLTIKKFFFLIKFWKIYPEIFFYHAQDLALLLQLVRLVWFYDISTFIGYLMPNSVLYTHTHTHTYIYIFI